MLSQHGTRAGEPYIKHLDAEIWELRPLRDRVLFVAWIDGSFVLLHHFMKKTQKIPRKEIEQAKKHELKDLKELILKHNNEIREILFAVEMERRSEELNKGLGEEHSLEEMKKMLEEI